MVTRHYFSQLFGFWPSHAEIKGPRKHRVLPLIALDASCIAGSLRVFTNIRYYPDAVSLLFPGQYVSQWELLAVRESATRRPLRVTLN